MQGFSLITRCCISTFAEVKDLNTSSTTVFNHVCIALCCHLYYPYFISINLVNQPAEYERFLSIDPDSDNAPILLAVVVAGCADSRPDESHI